MTEIDDEGEGEGEDQEDRPAAGQKRYITRQGARKLHRELLFLLNEERPRITAEVSAAAAQGDRSENAEYIYGKKRLREIDRRIRFLQRRLDTATVVEPSEQKDTSRVYFGATLTLEDEEGQELHYQIVGPDELDTRGGRVSVDSPMGRALIGKAVGACVVVKRPRGDLELTVRRIQYLRCEQES